MSQKVEEKGFHLLTESTELLQQALDTSFFDAYLENMENFLDSQTVRVIEGTPDPETAAKLQRIYQDIKALELTAESKRKISQLTLLKGMLSDTLQPNHQLTPDGIGFLVTYIVEELLADRLQLRVADLAVGTGNLLYTLMTNLALSGKQVSGVGVDADELLLNIAAVDKEWLGLDVTLFYQDSIQPLLLDPVDVAIADLPIGYYPDDARASSFTVAAETGHTYAHHLLMEQAMNYVTQDGFGVFLLPSQFLESEQAGQLKKWLTEKVYLQAILQLPENLFKNRASRKSIIVVQNRGEGASQATEVLLAELPSLKETQAVYQFIEEFNQWQHLNLKKKV
ncbi:class I SAM-dependent methyltransferase [Vagococcus acidifermentans]|uniref:SAM-dependent methyltransferase n=1 Tax=Vagococcus acidifermentans TaxID=564710 RepID=A0A430B2Y0_9ENTE|nr:class I SAM-dependent methyltransferase [Vagococcus acidifermentans]RSU14591.1 SAM-dependent methyltransferase [Vagococcus acidifermentans]